MNSIIFVICYITGAVDSGGYFTDLITKGLGLAGQSENPAPAQDVVAQDEVQAIGKRNQRRTKNSQLKRMNNL